MSVDLGHFIKAVETIAPPWLVEAWDNSGLILRCSDTVSKVLVALDVTKAVATEARETGCDMILAHHPLLFEPKKTLDSRHAADDVLMELIKAGISLYAAHTSYDKADGGINDMLAHKIGLVDVRAAEDGLMRIGCLPKQMDKDTFLHKIKSSLNALNLRISAVPHKNITCVAVAGGSGGDFLFSAKEAGAQALITGEAKYHHFLESQSLGICLVCAGHFETECHFTQQIFMSLQAWLDEVELDLAIVKSSSERAPYTEI